MSRTLMVASLFLASFALAQPARAMSCQKWSRLGPDQKAATIEVMIDDALAGSKGRSYRVDRHAIKRCMHDHSRAIALDFDSACSDGRTASMQALNGLFKNYIWTCVN